MKKNINGNNYSFSEISQITAENQNKKNYNFEAIYLKKTKQNKIYPQRKIEIDNRKVNAINQRFKEKDFLYDTSIIYDGRSKNYEKKKGKILKDYRDKLKLKNKNYNFQESEKSSLWETIDTKDKIYEDFGDKYIKLNNENQQNNYDFESSNEFNNSKINKNNNMSSDNIKLNILKNLDEKLKNSTFANSKQINNSQNFNQNIDNTSIYNKNNINSKNNTQMINTSQSNRSSRSLVKSKSIKRFNTFVSIEENLFKFKNEKSLERKNTQLNKRENDLIFNSNTNVPKFQKIVEEFKGNTINDLLNSISNAKVIKENLEYSVENLENEIFEKKAENNLTKKNNLSNKVDTQSFHLLQNETNKENKYIGKNTPKLIVEINESNTELEVLKQETNFLISEVDKEKYEINLIQNDIKGIKSEIIKINKEIMTNKHCVIKNKKENEALKKIIVKQEISNRKYFQEVENLAEETRKYTQTINKTNNE